MQIRRISVICGLCGTSKGILSNSWTTDETDLTDSHGFWFGAMSTVPFVALYRLKLDVPRVVLAGGPIGLLCALL